MEAVLEAANSRSRTGAREGGVSYGEASWQLSGAPCAVAVKFYGCRRTAGTAQQQRFLREIEAFSRCPSDESLVPLLAVCFPSLACIFPWAQGGSLRDLLCSGHAPPPADGFRIIQGAAQGLAVLHAHRLVHRDISSANVLLFESDAGSIARIAGCGSVSPNETSNSSSSGSEPTDVVGVPPYVDPLYLSLGRCQPANDVFSLGVVALEVILGRPASESTAPGPTDSNSNASLGAIDATRRQRDEPFWAPFDGQLFDNLQVAGQAAAARVLRERPRPDWHEQALEAACRMIAGALQVGAAREVSSLAARPSAREVADSYEVCVVLQEEGPARPERKCLVCMTEAIDTQLRPCRHSCMCEGCAVHFMANGGRPCPICRKPVASYQLGDYESTFVDATLLSQAAF